MNELLVRCADHDSMLTIGTVIPLLLMAIAVGWFAHKWS